MSDLQEGFQDRALPQTAHTYSLRYKILLVKCIKEVLNNTLIMPEYTPGLLIKQVDVEGFAVSRFVPEQTLELCSPFVNTRLIKVKVSLMLIPFSR